MERLSGSRRCITKETEQARAGECPWSFEVCQDCGRPNVVGFTVTDEVWAAVMGEKDAPGVFCIFCFDKRATVKGVAWDQQPVNWWPISAVSNALWGNQQQFTMAEQLTAAAAREGELTKALERIMDKDTLPWPDYEAKWGKDPKQGLGFTTSSDIARDALKVKEQGGQQQ